jgi:hypothetical protein
MQEQAWYAKSRDSRTHYLNLAVTWFFILFYINISKLLKNTEKINIKNHFKIFSITLHQMRIQTVNINSGNTRDVLSLNSLKKIWNQKWSICHKYSINLAWTNQYNLINVLINCLLSTSVMESILWLKTKLNMLICWNSNNPNIIL